MRAPISILTGSELVFSMLRIVVRVAPGTTFMSIALGFSSSVAS